MKSKCVIFIEKLKQRWLEIVVILFCMALLGAVSSQKEGYHMDELLSFQLSNAEYNPWIVATQPEGRLAKFIHNEIDGETLGETIGNLIDTAQDVLHNRWNSKLLSYEADVYEEPVWITAETFSDYVSVDCEDDFNYLSVYFNVKDDNHPPVHFMLLHTLSSLFRGTVRPFVGCIINMAAVAVTMCLLMKIGYFLGQMLGVGDKGRFLGIFAALLYGISTGALASVLLIRMYCVLTMFCIALLYWHLKKWHQGSGAVEDTKEKKCGFAADNKGLIAVTVLGFLTQYFFLFYCIVLAAVTAVLLAYKKRLKELVAYIRSMMIAAAIGLVCFPFAVADVFSSERGVEALDNLSSGLAGYGTRLIAFWNILADRTFGAWLTVVLAMVFVIAMVGVLVVLHKRENRDNRSETACVLWIMLVPAVGYFLLAARMAPYLVDRYIMPLFPLVILLAATGLVIAADCLERAKKSRKILYSVCGVVLVLELLTLSQYDGSYLYTGYKEQLEVAEKYAEYPCICVYDGVGYYENLLEFTNYEQTLLVTEAQLAERMDVTSVSTCEKVVVLIKEEVDWENLCRILEEKYSLIPEEELLRDSVHGDRLMVFTSLY